MNKDIPLGKSTQYASEYCPELLFPVARQIKRDELGLQNDMPFIGVDIWTGYELSWLNQKGKPQVAIALFEFANDSANIVESKSFKLYLNSFNQTQFASWQQVQTTLYKDLSDCAQGQVKVELFSLDAFDQKNPISQCQGVHLDELDISDSVYDYQPDLLRNDMDSGLMSETVFSHLLKSNCLITNQPDWASIIIEYKGQKIHHESLLKYLISFRNHNEFHEQCVERIFTDIMKYCQPELLTVYARYTRRGGLDINPFRTNVKGKLAPSIRLSRQ